MFCGLRFGRRCVVLYRAPSGGDVSNYPGVWCGDLMNEQMELAMLIILHTIYVLSPWSLVAGVLKFIFG